MAISGRRKDRADEDEALHRAASMVDMRSGAREGRGFRSSATCAADYLYFSSWLADDGPRCGNPAFRACSNPLGWGPDWIMPSIRVTVSPCGADAVPSYNSSSLG